MELTSITPGPAGLRALAHPVRLRILGILRNEGPATASGLAARLGLNSGATSYHLRQLAQHGFITDDSERGTGRDRWWKAAHQSTRMDSRTLATEEEQDTFDAYLQSVAIVSTERLQRAMEGRRMLPRAWQDASTISNWAPRLTPARAKELIDALSAVMEEWEEDPEDTEGAESFTVSLQAFVLPGTVTIAPEEGTP
jgi:DNA-binding transcriptional ArsR family regulator